MATYRGQARSQGFDPVKIPDTARQMLEAAERKRKAQERAYTLDIDQQNSYNSAIEDKNRREEYAVKENMNQMDAYQRAYRDQLKENYARLAEKDKAKAAQDIQNISRLGEFSQSALKLAGDLKQNYKDEQEDFGRSLVAKYRVTKEQYNQLRMSEADLQAEGAANNQIVELLKSRNASPDEIAAIRKLDGWRLYGAQQEWAKSGGENFKNYLKKNRDKKFDIDDGVQISLNEAKEYQDGKFYGIIQDQLIAEYSKPYGNLDPAFASKYFYPEIDDAVRQDNIDFISERSKILRQQETNGRLTQINNVTGPEDTMRHIRSQGLDNAGNTKQFLADAIIGLENPGTYEQTVKAVGYFLEAPSGQDPKQSNKKLYLESKTVSEVGTLMQGVLTKIDDIRNENFEQKQRTDDVKHQQRLNQMKDGGFYDATPAQQEQMRISYRQTHHRDFDREMISFMSQKDGMTDSNLEDHVYTTILNGATITPEQIKRLGKTASPKLVATLIAKVQENSVYQKRHSETKASFTHALKTSLNRQGSVTHGAEVDDRVHYAMKILHQKFTENLSNNGPDDAYRLALIDVQKLIEAGRGNNPAGDFAVIGVGDKAEFQAFNNVERSADAVKYDKLEKVIAADENSLYTERLLGDITDTESWIFKFKDPLWRNSREIPWYIKKAAQQFKVTPEKLLNTQLRLYNQKPIDFSLNRYTVPEEAIPPNLRRIINSHPSTGKKARVLQMTHAMRDPGDRHRPMLNLMASQESSNDTVHGGYDALNTGGYGRYPEGTSTGERNLGRPLTSFTVKEIMNMQQSGKLVAAGRYQFVPDTLIEQVRDQNIDPNALFDEATQDQLAIGYLNTSIGYFRSIGQNVVYGLGQRWHGLQNVSRAEMQRHIDFLDQDPRVNDNFSGLDYRESVLKSHYNK